MKKLLIAGITAVTFALAGGAAYATKDIGAAVGQKSCKTCHEGSPKDKKIVPKVAEHIKKCKASTADQCKSCHNGNNKGSKKCK
jgi:nitrate/TMAO reductase-like tetraheme cytochrome c subunit